MSLHRRPVRLLALPAPMAVLAVAVLAGCSPGTAGARVVPPPAPPADVAGLCATLHKELPDTVAGLERSATEPPSDLTAAWGGSAIVLRCGIPKPPAMSDSRQDGVEVNGVPWLLEPLEGGGFRFTTGLRLAYTEVTVDKAHAKDTGFLVPLSAAVKKSVPEGIASY
ncbi:DUF3515 family protein [Streptomyces sp. NPDC006529]|uniref:DUF3515 family protein n=1 Tax=Streptomyces sp. NPDC006529 TaxID=3157177 RepID=UPI0033A53448